MANWANCQDSASSTGTKYFPDEDSWVAWQIADRLSLAEQAHTVVSVVQWPLSTLPHNYRCKLALTVWARCCNLDLTIYWQWIWKVPVHTCTSMQLTQPQLRFQKARFQSFIWSIRAERKDVLLKTQIQIHGIQIDARDNVNHTSWSIISSNPTIIGACMAIFWWTLGSTKPVKLIRPG